MKSKRTLSKVAYVTAVICLFLGLMSSNLARQAKPSTMRAPVGATYNTLTGKMEYTKATREYHFGNQEAYSVASAISGFFYVCAVACAVGGYRLKKSAQMTEALEVVTWRGSVLSVAEPMITFEFDNGERRKFINENPGLLIEGDVGEIQCKGDYIVGFTKRNEVPL